MDISNITRKRGLLEPNDPSTGSHNRRDEEIEGLKIEIGAGDVCDRLFGCTFRDCEIRLKSSGRLTAVATNELRFDSCLIWASKKQIIPTWDAEFAGCYFKGKFETRFARTVVDTHFTKATLDSAVFHQVEPLGAIAWPLWPHIIVDQPRENFDQWAEISKPKSLTNLLRRTSGICTAIFLPAYLDDPDEFWDSVHDVPFIHRHLDE